MDETQRYLDNMSNDGKDQLIKLLLREKDTDLETYYAYLTQDITFIKGQIKLFNEMFDLRSTKTKGEIDES